MNTENLNENWVQQTASMLLTSEPGKPFDGWTEYVPWYWLVTESEKIIKNGVESIFKEKVTQAESQKVRQIFQVLAQIGTEPMNTTTIKIRSGLSWDSVNRTLKILRRKNIVNIEQHIDKKNNEKLYTLNKNKSIEYQKNLIFWKCLVQTIKSYKKSKNETIYEVKISRRIPEKFLDRTINVPPHMSKEMKINVRKIRIGELPVSSGKYLINRFQSGMICYDCFDKGDVIILKSTKDGTFLCSKCGKENSLPEEMPISDGGVSKWRKYQMKKEFETINKKPKP